MGSASECSPAHHRSRRGDFSLEQSQPGPAGTGPRAFGIGRHRAGNQIPVRAGNQTSSHDRHVYHVRDSDRQRRQRPGSRQDLVQGAALGAEKFWPLDHLRRRRSDGGECARLSQLSVRGLAGAAGFRQKVDAGNGNLLSRAGRPGDAADAGRRRWSISAVITNFATPVFSCCSVTAIPPSGKPRTTPIWGCIGLGAREASRTSPRTPLSMAWRLPGCTGSDLGKESLNITDQRRPPSGACRLRRYGLYGGLVGVRGSAQCTA